MKKTLLVVVFVVVVVVVVLLLLLLLLLLLHYFSRDICILKWPKSKLTKAITVANLLHSSLQSAQTLHTLRSHFYYVVPWQSFEHVRAGYGPAFEVGGLSPSKSLELE